MTLRATRVSRAEVGEVSDVWAARNFPVAGSEFSEFLKITVTDNGIGISRSGLEQLFRPFSQIDSGLARKFEGTGLGLAMVKLLAELHGGAVAVESAVGEGSCFTVWLPFRPAAEEARPTSTESSDPRINELQGPRTALVIEDDLRAAELIRVQLEGEGFEVLHAANTKAALVLAAKQPLSLITLDLMLTDEDGWHFLTRLKQMPELRRVPIVIISIVADRAKGIALGAAAVMQKPISRQELCEALVLLGLSPVAPGRMMKVLVVDDDPKAVELIAIRLPSLGSKVLRAFGGREAIDIARRELPDLIVLDLMMPDVNGFEVVDALSHQAETVHIPILVVTAKDVSAEERAVLKAHTTTIIGKSSFDGNDFLTEVRRAVPHLEVV